MVCPFLIYISYSFMMPFYFNLLFIIAAFNACTTDNSDNIIKEEEFVRFEYDLENLEVSNLYIGPEDKGIIENTGMINEASGMSSCRSNHTILWVHNDSGHAAHLHAVGSNGENLGYFWVRGTGNRDWEDMCVGPGPQEGVQYVYIGDIGDNNAQYKEILINRFPEPNMVGVDSFSINDIPSDQVDRIIFKYPEGPRDAETLMIDPWTKDLYIVTKREVRSSLYIAKYPYDLTNVNYLKKIAEFPFNRAIAGDISTDGTNIVIKTDRRLYYWKRGQNETIIDALKKQPILLPYFVEPQGESFAWSVNSDLYYTLSEQSGDTKPRLYVYSKK